ncbi:MAG TPA: type II secretion system minor pseudopilin GspK [Gammaproteobacteria bacterium]|nr:type II secretion system minor pseudopilin GspK [Gammaproteobacteria bacterium]
MRPSSVRPAVPAVPPVRRQRGVAILTAMLVVAIGTMIAANLLWDAALDQRRTAAALSADQGLLYVQGAEAWVGDILRQDLVDSPDSDNLGEEWAMQIPPLPIDGGVITGHLEDLQGRFNLNNLIQPTGEQDKIARAQFERLLTLLELDPSLAGAVVDWLDPDGDAQFPGGGEDALYADANPVYRTPNTMITSTSELMAINGFDKESYNRLAPYVTALPIGTKINVNTAPAVVLASLSDSIDLATAESLVEERGDAGFADIDAAFEGLVEPDMLQRIDGVTEHFLLTVTVMLGDNQLNAYSVLQRDTSGVTRTLFRSFGAL